MDFMTIEPRDWPRISGYLDEALDLDPPAREAWLAGLAATQPELAATLRSLLAERELANAEGFLQHSTLAATTIAALYHASMAGTKVGAYTLDRPLGHGGMGEVWLASRSDGRFEGQCAIKFLNALEAQPRLAERFRLEGGVLARLGHPNIARLLDAGETSDGRQFLVLEYVDGVSIDAYCNANELTLPARVRLFLGVVAAVAHAHSQLIIHRDLKPSNVLVTHAGTVKLLDFGIAKLLSAGQAPGDSTSTRVEEMVLTPEYAAPEQLLGEMPSTATDVYQLGLLLYVLLAGRHPLQPHGSRAQRIKAALNSKVPRASDFATGALRKQLRGDLDAILKMALDPEPARRYATAAAFREELIRYLDREPVNARRGARVYHVRKFISRHRVAVAASLVATAALFGTLVFALSQARIAAQERDHALALASRNGAVTEFLGTVITDAAASDKPVSVVQMLERSEKLVLADTSGSPENRAAVLSMIGARYGSVDQRAKAAELFEKALALLAGSKNDSLRSELTCLHASAVAMLGQMETSVKVLEQEIARVQDPEVAAYCLLYRSFAAIDVHDGATALRYAQRGIESFHAAPQVPAADEGIFLGAVGMSYHLNGMNREADEYFQRAMSRYAELGRESSANATSVRNNWAIMVDGAGAPKRALEIYDRALALDAQANQGGAPPSFLIGNRAKALEAMGRYAEALAAYQTEISVAEQQHNMMGEAHALSGLASVSQAMHDSAAATQYLQRMSAILAPVVPRGAPPWRLIAVVQGRLDMDGGRFDAARQQFTNALANSSSSGGMAARLGRSEAEVRAGNAAAAAQDAQLALETARAMQGNLPFSHHTGLSWLALGRAQLQLGKQAEARHSLEAAVEQLAHTVDDAHPALREARSLLMTGSSPAAGSAT
jgi:serine/threonine protein kinase